MQSRNAIKKRRRWPVLLGILVLLGGYVAWCLQRSLPPVQPTAATQQFKIQAPESSLAWSDPTQAAVGVVGTNIIETHGLQKPAPTASTAKIITALMVLQKYPLALGQSGPRITLTDKDVAYYNEYVAQDGSVVPVQAGEQITEYQMLQALMLPSANNMADSLAVWAYGSLADYAAAANTFLQAQHLTGSHVGSDASGLAPNTTSTAQDLVHLGMLAVQNPVLKQIVGQKTATGIPLTTSIKNVNFLLGTHNIIGLKTGNSDQAGGVFISASQIIVDGQPVVIVTARIGAPDLFSAVQGSLPLIISAQGNFSHMFILHKGATVGHYNLPWGGSVGVTAPHDITAETWNGSQLPVTITLRAIKAGSPAGTAVGSLRTSSSLSATPTVNLALSGPVNSPPLWWRLTHPF